MRHVHLSITEKMKITPIMKKVILIAGILVLLTAAHVVFAQNQEGVITYEVKVNLHRRLPPERAEMKAMIPEFRTTKDQLFFNASASLFKPLIEDEDDQEISGGGVHMQFRQPNNELYLDQPTGKIVSKQEFMGKDYLMDDSLKVAPWKIGTETRTIQGFLCKQAYYTDDSMPDRKQEVTAWFTDQIRPFLGPERFHSLPGAVLAVDINNGERVIVAAQIEFRALRKNEIKVPTSGQKTTKEDFRKMVDERMKQMGGQGGFVIRN